MGTGYTGWSCVDRLIQDASDWKWALKFAWLPAKMDSGEYLWFKDYYHGVRFVFGPAGEDPIILHQYMTPQEYLFNTLKNS
jgi:hypothetical protein